MRSRRWACLVTGPMQAISAVEALHHFAAKGSVHYYSAEPPDPAIRRLVERAGFNFEWVARAGAFGRFAWFCRLLARVLTGCGVMLGSLHQRPFLLAATCSRRTPVLLDDGQGTVAIVARRNSRQLSRSFLSRRLDRRPLTVFSIYHPATTGRDRLIENRLDFVRSLHTGPTGTLEQAWIVGGPFVEHDLLTEDEYLSALRRYVQGPRSGLELVYVQHPRESDAHAIEVCEQLGLHRTRLPAPIELQILASRQTPRELFSICSTVLDTLPLLAPDFPQPTELWTSPLDPRELEHVPPALAERLRTVAARDDLHKA